MSRRCLICANLNPCRCHTREDQDAEFYRNCREVRRIERAKQRSLTLPMPAPEERAA